VIEITSGKLTARINPLGAELTSLTDKQGHEYLSSGDPAFWRGRAPLLFPIVGRLQGDSLRIDGQSFAMEKHGFARRSTFELVTHETDWALFRLTDDAATRAQYPFSFALDAEFALAETWLEMTVTVRNTGDAPLPFSFGYHPAFAWPIPGGGGREAHEIVFENAETGALRRVTPEGMIGPDAKASPVHGDRFRLNDALFADDALVWTDLASHRLTYGAPGATALVIDFPDTPHLGIWTKPGAAFVCVEPWAGHADPLGYRGDFHEKPGVMTLDPMAERSFRMDVAVRI
jgi:galactose mutarotase-like enzyme